MKAYELGRGPLSSVLEAVQYDLAPQLHRRSAHLWIEDVGPRGVVLGLTCWGDAKPAEQATWVRARLKDFLDDQALAAVLVGVPAVLG